MTDGVGTTASLPWIILTVILFGFWNLSFTFPNRLAAIIMSKQMSTGSFVKSLKLLFTEGLHFYKQREAF